MRLDNRVPISRPPAITGLWLCSFVISLNTFVNQLVRIVNGLISFGNGTDRDNIEGEWTTLTLPALATTVFNLTPTFGRAPVGFLVLDVDGPAQIYRSAALAVDTIQLTGVNGTGAVITAKVFII